MLRQRGARQGVLDQTATVRDWFNPTTETGAKVYLAALVVLFVGAVAFMIFYGVDFRKLGRD